MFRLILVCLLLINIYHVNNVIADSSSGRHCGDDSNWNYFENHCYQVVSTSKDWASARSFCKDIEANLASIHSEQETQFLFDWIRSSAVNAKYEKVWIGLNSLKTYSDDVYEWDDGSELDYINWAAGEPNNDLNIPEECGQIITRNGFWNDAPCSGRMGFVCKKLALSSTSQPLELNDARQNSPITECLSGWRSYDNKCFSVFGGESYGKLTWTEAAEECQKHGGHLASIHSKEEHEFLVDYSQITSGSKNVWIGLHDRRIKDLYEWDDNSPMNYTNWGPGQPSEPKYGVEDCGELRHYDSKDILGRWNDAACHEKRRYLCELINEPSVPETYMGCAEGWLYFQNKCYKGLGDIEFERETWEYAEKMCSSMKANLVSIKDQQEEDFVFVHILLLMETDDVWIGLNDKLRESHYVWTDNSEYDYANWKIGEPSGYANEREDCVEYYYCNDIEAIWNDCPCDNEFGYICEAEPDTPTLTPPADAIMCTEFEGWYKFRDSCFKKFAEDDGGKTWDEAEEDCRKHGGHLATIKDTQDHLFLKTILRNDAHSTWIGLRKNSNRYEWSSENVVSFTKWSETPEKPCVSRISTGEWETSECSEKLPFLCEILPNPVLPKGPERCPLQPADWIDIGTDYCYYIPRDKYVNWEHAHLDCTRRRGRLLTIRSQEEHDILQKYLIGYPSWKSIYTGMYRDYEGNFQWLDGSPVTFQNWHEGQPNDENEFCVVMQTQERVWHDYSCSNKFGYICEIEKEIEVPGDFAEYLVSNCNVSLPVENTLKTIQTESLIKKLPYKGCKDGWLYFKDKCYKGIGNSQNDHVSWDLAQQMCSEMDSNLLSIQSAEEQDFVYYYVLLPMQIDSVWIGLNDKEKESKYIWSDGSEFRYTNWNAGEPSGSRNEKEDCVEYHYYYNYDEVLAKWSDIRCDLEFGYICKADAVTPSSTPPPDVTKCTEFLGWDQFRNSCYKIFDGDEGGNTWDEAEAICIENGGHLATINDTQDHVFLTHLLKNQTPSAWIGLRSTSGRYEWSSGNIVSFTKWSKTPKEPCVFRNSDGKWETSECSVNLPFICEILPDPVLPKSDGRCPLHLPDWVDLGTDYCYYYPQDEHVTWGQGELDCRRRGGSFVTIHNQEENEALQKFLAGISSWRGIYIGLVRDYEDNFQWLDGSPVTFENWYEGQPNEGNENCVAMNSQHREWHDYGCSDTFNYICNVMKVF